MAYTRHGYHIPFSEIDNGPRPMRKTCLGANGCKACALDTRAYWSGVYGPPKKVESPKFDEREIDRPKGHNLVFSVTRDDFPVDVSSDDYLATAKAIVRDRVGERMRKRRERHADYEIYILWSSTTLLSWRVLMVSSHDDGKFYEVRHDNATNETTLHSFHRFHITQVSKLEATED